MPFEFAHHSGEPSAPRTSGAEDPNYVLGPCTPGYFLASQPQPGSHSERPALPRQPPSGPPELTDLSDKPEWSRYGGRFAARSGPRPAPPSPRFHSSFL